MGMAMGNKDGEKGVTGMSMKMRMGSAMLMWMGMETRMREACG